MTGTARTSPPAERVVAVLETLARHPGRGYGLSELARHAGLSKPTCLGIVTTLVDAGYLVRSEHDKAYRLGPALVSLGRAARKSLRTAPAGGPALAAVSRRFGAPASLSAVVSGRVTVLDVVGGGARVRAGDGYPVAEPLLYRLWDPDFRVDGRHGAIVEQCRADGFLVELRTAAGAALHQVVTGAGGDVPVGMLDEVVARIGDRVLRADAGEGPHAVSVLSAPVFDGAGRQAAVVSLYLDADLTWPELRERGGDLARAARRIAR